MRHTYPDEYFIYLYMDKVSFLNYKGTKLELLEESREREREREKMGIEAGTERHETPSN